MGYYNLHMYIAGDGWSRALCSSYDQVDPPVVELPQLVGCMLVVHTDHPVIQAAHNLVVVHLNLRTIRYEKQVSAHLITMDGLHCAKVYWYQREDSSSYYERDCLAVTFFFSFEK